MVGIVGVIGSLWCLVSGMPVMTGYSYSTIVVHLTRI